MTRPVSTAVLLVLAAGCSPARRTTIPPHLAGSTSSSCCDSAHRERGEIPPAAPTEGLVEEPDIVPLPDGRLAAAWAIVDADGLADIVFAVADADASEWSAPRRINPRRGSAVAGRQVGARIDAAPDGQRIAIAWVDREEDPSGDILARVSTDGGRTFGPTRRVNDDPRRRAGEAGPAQEYHDVAIGPDGTIFITWLDERSAPTGRENQKQLHVAWSTGDGASWSENLALTDSPHGTCPCCRPSVTVSDAGTVHVVYRDRIGDELVIRTRSRPPGDSTWAPAVTLSRGWTFSGCPINGPAVAASGTGRVDAIWVEDDRLETATSADGGATFSPPRALPALGDEPDAGARSLSIAAGTASSAGLAAWVAASGDIEATRLADGRAATWTVWSATDDTVARSAVIARTGPDLAVGFTVESWSLEPAAATDAAPRLTRVRDR